MMRICAMMIAAAFSVQPLPQAEGPLEPSVQNEVDHAIDLGEKWLERNFKEAGGDTGATNCVLSASLRSRGMRDPAEIENPQDAKGLRGLGGQLGLTNGQTRTEIALKLISTQNGGGWWLFETNAAPTRLAVKILKGL